VGAPLLVRWEDNGKGLSESPPIWCLDIQENIVVLGTGSGRIELWDAFRGYLKVNLYFNPSAAKVLVT